MHHNVLHMRFTATIIHYKQSLSRLICRLLMRHLQRVRHWWQMPPHYLTSILLRWSAMVLVANAAFNDGQSQWF
jgi:hypothetical protein